MSKAFIVFSTAGAGINQVAAMLSVPETKLYHVTGCFDGEVEDSVLLYVEDITLEPEVLMETIYVGFGQESYLFVSSEREGYLVTPPGNMAWIGHYQQTRVMPKGDWTKFGNYYFSVTQEDVRGAMPCTL